MTQTGHHSFFDIRARGDWVRLRTLIALRWMAITGQASAVLLATQVLDIDLPMAASAVVISASVSFNIAANIVHPAEKRLGERGTLVSLLFDLVQLVIMLMLCGGLNNPFAMLIVGPVIIAATALRLRATMIVAIPALLSIPLLTFVHLPLKQFNGDVLTVPDLYLYGVAASLIIGMLFVALYARRVTLESFAMSQALSATQLALAREQRLAAIGGIAAATAHELGTPLATIKLVAGELTRDVADNPELADDLALIRSEAERCGVILKDLSQGGRDDSHVKLAPISSVIEEAAQPHMDRGADVIIRIDGRLADEADDTQPTLKRSPELIHGLRNAIQNAVDFAETTVWIDTELNDTRLRIAVGDDGPGFSQEILPRLGQPYISTRARGERPSEDGEYEGMGLGLFIARTLLERTGARLSFANGSDRWNRADAAHAVAAEDARPPGAIIEMIWRDAGIVASRDEMRSALGPNQRFDM